MHFKFNMVLNGFAIRMCVYNWGNAALGQAAARFLSQISNFYMG